MLWCVGVEWGGAGGRGVAAPRGVGRGRHVSLWRRLLLRTWIALLARLLGMRWVGRLLLRWVMRRLLGRWRCPPARAAGVRDAGLD